MNLAELRTFLTIIETSSLVRASHVLNVTQSTVTARLKSLEEEIGQTLLIRNKSGVTLTAAGVRLHRYADTISDLWRQAQQETALPDGMSGICNIACEYDLWKGWGDYLFEILQKCHPQVAISVWLGSATDVASWLNEGKSDLGLTYHSAQTQRQGQIELEQDTLILVATSADTSTHANPDYIYVEAGQAFGREHAAYYADTDTTRINFGNAVLALEHLLKSGGSAYLPQRMAQEALDQKKLFLLYGVPDFYRPVYLTYNQSAKASWPWFDGVMQSLIDR